MAAAVPLFAESFGSTTTPRSYSDTTPGQVYIYNGDVLPSGISVANLNIAWYNSYDNDSVVTPILFQESTPGVFTVVAVGSSYASPTGLQEDPFGLQYGASTTGSDYTFGFVNAYVTSNGDGSTGTITSTGAGAVDFDAIVDPGTGVSGGSSTNDWVFTPSDYYASTISLGDTFALPSLDDESAVQLDSNEGDFNTDRTYSACLTDSPSGGCPIAAATPEPGSAGLLLISGMLGLALLYRSRRAA